MPQVQIGFSNVLWMISLFLVSRCVELWACLIEMLVAGVLSGGISPGNEWIDQELRKLSNPELGKTLCLSTAD